MNKTQKAALKKSIAHWKDNEKRQSENKRMQLGCQYCACCALSAKEDLAPLMLNRQGWECNTDCPIYEYTEQLDCEGTPYYRVVDGDVPAAVMTRWLESLLNGEQPPVINNNEEED